jgi:hypothetical protein
MNVVLLNKNFVNNKLVVGYGTRQQATFTIVDEAFQGNNNLGTINRVTCLIQQFDATGNAVSSNMLMPIIGIGDNTIMVMCDNKVLRGTPLTHDNMEQCTVDLKEV